MTMMISRMITMWATPRLRANNLRSSGRPIVASAAIAARTLRRIPERKGSVLGNIQITFYSSSSESLDCASLRIFVASFALSSVIPGNAAIAVLNKLLPALTISSFSRGTFF